MGKKNYVLDTNILIQTPNAIFGFDDNNVYITGTTLQELDVLKTAPGETGFCAREAIRNIYSLIENGSLLNGFCLQHGGMFYIEQELIVNYLPEGYSNQRADNRIINTALQIVKRCTEETILVTNDVSMAINAKAVGLKAQPYKNIQVEGKKEYLGKRIVELESPEIINSLYKNEWMDIAKAGTGDMLINEFVILKCGQQSALCIRKDNDLYRIDENWLHPYGIMGKSATSKMALYALMAPASEIPLVIIKGPAGCGKTFLSLAAGVDAVHSGRYDRVMITRTNVLSDADIGFLPGDLEEKMSPLIAPFIDNLKEIVKGKGETVEQIQLAVDDLFETGAVEICSMAYMRERSLTNSYLIIDEAQNATPRQILEIVTRAGMGTKIVICGDPDQIDNPKLDRRNNGLIFAYERMKTSSLSAVLTFSHKEAVRSPLACEAAERLKI